LRSTYTSTCSHPRGARSIQCRELHRQADPHCDLARTARTLLERSTPTDPLLQRLGQIRRQVREQHRRHEHALRREAREVSAEIARALDGGGGVFLLRRSAASAARDAVPGAIRRQPPPPRQLTRVFFEVLRLEENIGACLPARCASWPCTDEPPRARGFRATRSKRACIAWCASTSRRSWGDAARPASRCQVSWWTSCAAT
jgi:hypothetical protein